VPDEPVHKVKATLIAEGAGILNWMIAGCLEWLGDRRVPVPEMEELALTDFWAQSSPLGEWLDDECDLTDRAAETGSGELLKAFKAWMERNDVEEEQVKKWTATRFGKDLSQRQIISRKTRGNKVRVGIRLRGANPLLEQGAAPASAADDAFGDELDPFGAP